MMKIEKLFKKDINRDIQGVVTIGNEEESRRLWKIKKEIRYIKRISLSLKNGLFLLILS